MSAVDEKRFLILTTYVFWHDFFISRDDACALLAQLKHIEFLPALPPIRQEVIQEVIILLAMIVFFEVAQFMEYHIIDAIDGCLYQPGIQDDQA